MVMVYEFEKFNILTAEMDRSKCKMTEDRAKAHGCAIIEATGEDVAESALDEDGRYYPDA